MTMNLLRKIAKGPLPFIAEGHDLFKVATLLEVGMLDGTLEPMRPGSIGGRAVVRGITPLGQLYLEAAPLRPTFLDDVPFSAHGILRAQFGRPTFPRTL